MQDLSSEQFYSLMQQEKFFLFDIRNVDEFEKGHIEGKYLSSVLNIPYFDLIEKGGKEDFIESISYFIKNNLKDLLPKNEKILIVCAKGGTSAIVAEILRKLDYDAFSLLGGTKSWGDFYVRKDIVQSPDLSIYQIIRIARGCLSYVVVSDGLATVIDPSRHIQPYLEVLKELEVKAQFILDTHAHADHISGGKELAEKLSVPYYLHPYDGIHPMDMLPAKFHYNPSWQHLVYPLGKINIKALHIPGHTLGNQAFLIDQRFLFSGDSIFLESIARPDLGGQAKTWTLLHYDSLNCLMKLPDSMIVLPAHFSTPLESNLEGSFKKSLGELKKENQGLREAERSMTDFSEYILNNLPYFPKEYIDIKRVNLGLLSVNEEQASELELGKNICAVSLTSEMAKNKV